MEIDKHYNYTWLKNPFLPNFPEMYELSDIFTCKGGEKVAMYIPITERDWENASKNIILQLRKVITLRGMKPVEFASGKEKVNPNIAQKALSIHQNLRRTDEKDAFQRKIGKSYRDLLNAVKGRK